MNISVTKKILKHQQSHMSKTSKLLPSLSPLAKSNPDTCLQFTANWLTVQWMLLFTTQNMIHELMQPRKIIVFFGKSRLRFDVRTPGLKVYKTVLNAN